MTNPSEAETGTSMLCSVCDDPMEFTENAMARHDEDLGYVCKDCQWRLRIAVAHLQENGMLTCERRT